MAARQLKTERRRGEGGGARGAEGFGRRQRRSVHKPQRWIEGRETPVECAHMAAPDLIECMVQSVPGGGVCSTRGHAFSTGFHAILRMNFVRFCFFSVDIDVPGDKTHPKIAKLRFEFHGLVHEQ